MSDTESRELVMAIRGPTWTLEVCSACGTICGPPGDVRAAHESEVSSCAERGGKVERVVVARPEDIAKRVRQIQHSGGWAEDIADLIMREFGVDR